MPSIDSHQHFWKYSKKEYDWIDETMIDLQRDFLPCDLKISLAENNIPGCIAVQARQTEQENTFLF